MQLMIYVGGTLVLLIFGVMLTAQGPFINLKTDSGEWLKSLIVGACLLMILLYAAFQVPAWLPQTTPNAAVSVAGESVAPTATPIGMKLLDQFYCRLKLYRFIYLSCSLVLLT